MKPKKTVKAYKHKEVKRAFIPSAEEAGYEKDSAKVKTGPTEHKFPRNPIVQRGQDPELFWMHKYGADDTQDRTSVDIRSLYRHEHIAPETLIKGLYRMKADLAGPQDEMFSVNEIFGNTIGHEELDKVSDYYTHSDGWTNRLIQGDSLLVMNSLLDREGMAGQVQCLYFDPPYGIKYGSNWQIKLNNRTVTDGADDALSGEPEQIKAFRDTWELGIHSYLSYLRDRLLVAKELLHESGSCFVQISDENVHLVRCLMDEIFGSGNFVSLISFSKSAGGLQSVSRVGAVLDYIIWYAKDAEKMKYRPIFETKADAVSSGYTKLELHDGTRRSMTKEEKESGQFPENSRPYMTVLMTKPGPGSKFAVNYNGRAYDAGSRWWGTTPEGIQKVIAANRVEATENSIRFVTYFQDFPYRALTNLWGGFGGAANPVYVVQTNAEIVQRCLLLTTDPGDLVLDPTCGSGTTAYVAEQWGRRWITVDTSRIALNVAKTRLMTATFPYYQLYDQQNCDIRQGFIYKTVPHTTLANVANNEPPETETLYDRPVEDKKRLRVAGPLTVETLQNYEPVSPEELARQRTADTELASFEDLIFDHLKSAGVKTGDKRENAVFVRIDRLANSALHAEGWYSGQKSEVRGQKSVGGDIVEKKAYLHIGPKFGTVSKQAVTEAIKACRDKRDGDWLLILGFAFESGITELSRSFGNFQVSIVRMHDDLLQQGLLKKDKKAASFVTIGEPDIRLTIAPKPLASPHKGTTTNRARER